LVEVIGEFLFVVLLVTDTEPEFALLGPEHDGLAVHASDHVERRLGFATQGQLQKVLLDAGLDGAAQLGLDLEEAVRRTQSFDALIGPLVVVMLDPEFDPLTGGVEAVELGPGQEVLPDRGPEAFDFAEGHGMMWPGLEMGHTILFEFGFKPAGAPPTGVLPAVVGEHLLGRLELARGHAIHFDDGIGRGTAKQIRPHDEPRVIIHEGDEVGIAPAQPEREDVRLPHLIGGGPFKEAGPNHVALLPWWLLRHQLSTVQPLTHGLRAAWQEEPAPQQLGDAFDPEVGMLLLQFDDLVRDRCRQPGLSGAMCLGLQPSFAELAIQADPPVQGTGCHAHLGADILHAELLFQPQPDRLQPDLR
jgi:hypothetical protein